MAKRKFGEIENPNILAEKDKGQGRKGAEAKRLKQIMISFSPLEFERLKEKMTEDNAEFTPFAQYIREKILN